MLWMLCLWIGFQVPGVAQDPDGLRHSSLRQALTATGFTAAISARDAPALDAALTSSAVDAAGDTFVAAYYLRDELNGDRLGPLHVSMFRRPTNSWAHVPGLDDDGGSVSRVRVGIDLAVIELHLSPSASSSLVLDLTSARIVDRLAGFDVRPLANKELLFTANMVHFAPTQQQRLLIYAPGRRTPVEVFPGAARSDAAADYRRDVRAVYAALPPERRSAIERSVYGQVEDFDRSLSHIVERQGGGRFAFVATYHADRLGADAPRLMTLVRCDRGVSDALWRCEEHVWQDAAEAVGLAATSRSGDALDPAAIESVIRAWLIR